MTHIKAVAALAAASAFLIGGCSSAPNSLPPSGNALPIDAHSVAFASKPSANAVLAYVSDYYTGAIRVYNANLSNPPPLLTIPANGAAGLAVDKNGTLYVASPNNANVTEYTRGTTIPSKTISAGLTAPMYPAIDPQGDLWVTNSENPGNVVEYKPGGTTPVRTLTNGIAYPQGIAFDRNGNLFVADSNPNGGFGHVVMYAPDSTQPTATFGWKTLEAPSGVATDPTGNILVADAFKAIVVVYDRATHKPVRYDRVAHFYTDPLQLAVSPSNTRLYMAGGYNAFTVYEYGKYGQGTLLSDRIQYYLNSAVGIAIDPPVVK